MHRYSIISLIDSEVGRRNQQAKVLAGSRFYVRPYESVSDYSRRGETHTLVLANDECGTLEALLGDMRARDYWAPALGYGRSFDPVRCSQVILMGLVGYLPGPFTRADLEGLLDSSAEQLSASIDLRDGAADARHKLKALTTRESQVLEWLQAGLNNREIADNLAISPRTVEHHRANMMRKMNTKSTPAAIRMCVHAKLAV